MHNAARCRAFPAENIYLIHGADRVIPVATYCRELSQRRPTRTLTSIIQRVGIFPSRMPVLRPIVRDSEDGWSEPRIHGDCVILGGDEENGRSHYR